MAENNRPVNLPPAIITCECGQRVLVGYEESHRESNQHEARLSGITIEAFRRREKYREIKRLKIKVKREKKELKVLIKEFERMDKIKSKRNKKDEKELWIIISKALDEKVLKVKFLNITPNFRHKLIVEIAKKIRDALLKYGSINLNLGAMISFLLNETLIEKGFLNRRIHINQDDHIERLIESELDKISQRVEEQALQGSSAVFQRYINVDITITPNVYQSGGSFIKTPDFIKFKKAVVNVENEDNYCFVWSVLAALYPVKGNQHAYRVNKYKEYVYNLKYGNISFPMKINDIYKFEELNGISINVFGYNYASNQESFYPLYLSKYSYEKVIELLYLEEETVDENHEKKYHYVLIKNFNALVATALNIYKKTTDSIICRKCMIAYYSENSFNKHKTFCLTGNVQCIMPNDSNKFIEFTNPERASRHPIAIYSDIEALLIKSNDKISETSQEIKKQIHIPASVGYNVVTPMEMDIPKMKYFRGKNCMIDYVNELKLFLNVWFSNSQKYPRAKMSKDDWAKYNISNECWMCDKPFESITSKTSRKGNQYYPYKKVVDHCHISGKFVGAAHAECNYKKQTKHFVPIYFHNLSKYDSHMILTILNLFGDGRIKIIPKTEEEALSFSKYVLMDNKLNVELRFLDTYRLSRSEIEQMMKYYKQINILGRKNPY